MIEDQKNDRIYRQQQNKLSLLIIYSICLQPTDMLISITLYPKQGLGLTVTHSHPGE